MRAVAAPRMTARRWLHRFGSAALYCAAAYALPAPVSAVSEQRHLTRDEFATQLEVANYITVAALTLYAWEYLCTFPRELTMYRASMIVRPQVILFLLIRYSTVPAVVVPSYSLWKRFTDSSQCIPHEQETVAVVQFIVSATLSWRTIAIWRRKMWVVVFLIAFSLAVFGASLGLLYFSEDSLILTGSCRPAPKEGKDGVNTIQWFYLTCLIFDTVTLGLSSYKLWVYSAMGREINKPVFTDPFEQHRSMLESERKRRGSASAIVHRVNSAATLPYRALRDIYLWWATLTPLLARLFANGLVYFLVATAFNVANFILEALNSIHSKSFLTLWPALMCVLCQRMLLTEFDAVWTPYDPYLEHPGRELVDRVVPNKAAPRVSEIDRFHSFVTALEQRRDERQEGSCVQFANLEKTDPEAAHPPERGPPSEFAPSDVSPCGSTRNSRAHVFQMAHVPPSPLPALSSAQAQLAVRMAGLRPHDTHPVDIP